MEEIDGVVCGCIESDNLEVIWAKLWIPQTVMGWFWLQAGYTSGPNTYGGHYTTVENYRM